MAPQDRRQWLQHTTVATGLMLAADWMPAATPASPGRSAAAFDAATLDGALRACGIAAIAASDQVQVEAPDFEENGSVVSVRLACTLPGVRSMLLLVKDNPVVLTAQFHVGEAVVPNFSTRIRLAQSSEVLAVAVLDDGRALYARKAVTVIQGGCG